MQKIHNVLQKRNLAQYNTWITDTDPNSIYFQLTQLPDVLTAGKNAILINGSLNLIPTTQVLVELLDVNGNTIFIKPIPNYQEGLARVISIEVYNNTPPGIATLTVLGELKQDVNGNVPPPEWQNVYNVKWQKQFNVSPNSINTTKIRLYETPQIVVDEVLNSFRSGDPSIVTINGSASISLSGVPSNYIYDVTNPFPTDYSIISSLPMFNRDMVGGALRVVLPDNSILTSSIQTVVNNTIAQISPGVISGSNYTQFVSANFTMSFTESAAYIPTLYSRSFANILLQDLTPFSGEVYRAKIFATSIESPGQEQLLTDVVLKPTELLVTESHDSNPLLRIGFFTGQNIPDNYWTVGLTSNYDAYIGTAGFILDGSWLLDGSHTL